MSESVYLFTHTVFQIDKQIGASFLSRKYPDLILGCDIPVIPRPSVQTVRQKCVSGLGNITNL